MTDEMDIESDDYDWQYDRACSYPCHVCGEADEDRGDDDE